VLTIPEGWAVRVLPLTEENVERVLDEVRPSLMADGGNVALHEIDGLVVVLMLQGACGSCPSSTMTLKMGIETRLRDKIPEILEVEQIHDTETGLELNTENVEKVSQIPCHMLAYQSVFIVHATCLFSAPLKFLVQ
jgi:Fe-S cluster biogenesis protein NfuA